MSDTFYDLPLCSMEVYSLQKVSYLVVLIHPFLLFRAFCNINNDKRRTFRYFLRKLCEIQPSRTPLLSSELGNHAD